MDWASIESITRSEHGQDGVYFLDNGEEIHVLKAPENPSIDSFFGLYLELAKSRVLWGISTISLLGLKPAN